MIEIGSRTRNQPPPPHIVCQSLSDPTWSSIWSRRPDAVIRFDLSTDGSDGTSLRWTVLVNEPAPDDALIGQRS